MHASVASRRSRDAMRTERASIARCAGYPAEAQIVNDGRAMHLLDRDAAQLEHLGIAERVHWRRSASCARAAHATPSSAEARRAAVRKRAAGSRRRSRRARAGVLGLARSSASQVSTALWFVSAGSARSLPPARRNTFCVCTLTASRAKKKPGTRPGEFRGKPSGAKSPKLADSIVPEIGRTCERRHRLDITARAPRRAFRALFDGVRLREPVLRVLVEPRREPVGACDAPSG